MNRKHADFAAIVLLISILLVGFLTASRLFLSDGPTMGPMESAPAMQFLGPVLMTVVVASIVGGVYVFIRNTVFSAGESGTSRATPETDSVDTTGPGNLSDATAAQSAAETVEETTAQSSVETDGTTPSEQAVQRGLLDVLPDDERRILEPVIESPGLTQIKVRDRSDFSKSKVSQTVTDLEERGLLYRERTGRTYRVYPADDLEERV